MDHTPQQLRAGVGSVLAAIQRFAHAACQRVTGAPPAGTNASTNTSSVAVKSDGYAAGPGTAHTPEIDPLLSCLGTSAVKEMQIPFPDFISIPERFTSTAVDGKTFSVTYRPRQKLMDFKLHMDSRILRNTGSIVNVRGFIGAGKSHILLAYAVYMMGLRTLGFNVPRVIYLSNCSRAAANIVQSIKMAFALAYFAVEGNTHNIVLLTTPSELLIYREQSVCGTANGPSVVLHIYFVVKTSSDLA
jgi:hypothetical protein